MIKNFYYTIKMKVLGVSKAQFFLCRFYVWVLLGNSLLEYGSREDECFVAIQINVNLIVSPYYEQKSLYETQIQ